MAQLYKNLEELKTKSTIVFLDASFSGMSFHWRGTWWKLQTNSRPGFKGLHAQRPVKYERVSGRYREPGRRME